MSHDGLPVRAETGARAARADRRASSGRISTRRHLAYAAELIAILALLVAACSSNNSGVAGATATPGSSAAPSVEPSVEASVAPSPPTRLAVVFNEANASKVFGGGVLNDLGDGTTAVTLGVIAIGFDDPLPATLEQGACADLATAAPSGAPAASGSPAASAEASAAASAPAASGGTAASAPAASPTATPGPVTGPPYMLKDVSGGSSNTIIQAAPADLLATPYAIVLAKSAADPTVVACADVTSNPIAGSSSAPAESAPAESLPAESAAPSAS